MTENEDARSGGGDPRAGRLTAGGHVAVTVPESASPWQRAGGAGPASRPGRPVGRISTVIAQQPWFRCGTPEQRRMVVQAIQAARQRAHDRKARVRAHPDLADRLCRSLGYARIDQWTGYVPGSGDNWAGGASPVRAEMIAILHQVVEREKAPA